MSIKYRGKVKDLKSFLTFVAIMNEANSQTLLKDIKPIEIID